MIGISPIESYIYSSFVASIFIANIFVLPNSEIGMFVSTQALLFKNYLETINFHKFRQNYAFLVDRNI